MNAEKSSTIEKIENVTENDLPLYCPTQGMPLWSSHPKVFLAIEKTGEVDCPYCGTKYRLITK